jgi:calcineurin-binding protein cabin-1
VQRVIADAEREVALETVAESETVMDTDNEPLIQAGVAPSIGTSLIQAGVALPIGTSLTVPQLPHSELSQLHRISEGSHDLRPSSSPLSGDSEATPTSLLEQCVYGVALCSVRCPAYYKSLYRLASTLHSLGHSQVARSLLLGPLPEPLLQAQDKLQPLFVLKPNIFANFWQIPVEEINRPGRFSSYARCSVQLLCDVLSQQRDSASLVFLVQHLRSRPDSSRQYLRDYERVAMCQKALQCCISVHKHLIGGRVT